MPKIHVRVSTQCFVYYLKNALKMGQGGTKRLKYPWITSPEGLSFTSCPVQQFFYGHAVLKFIARINLN